MVVVVVVMWWFWFCVVVVAMEFCGCCDGGGLGNGGLILLQLREGDLFSNMFSGKTLLVKGVVSKTNFYENVPPPPPPPREQSTQFSLFFALSQPFLTESIG